VLFRSGRYGYAEWISARQALQDAQLELVNAASTALSNQVLIEQLAGVALAASPLAIKTPTQLITTESGSSK